MKSGVMAMREGWVQGTARLRASAVEWEMKTKTGGGQSGGLKSMT